MSNECNSHTLPDDALPIDGEIARQSKFSAGASGDAATATYLREEGREHKG